MPIRELAHRVNDLLLPIVKGVGSERAYQYLTESLQTFGGSGFLQDYPIEQYIRDAKIDSLYEGTTAIQAQDFFFRKIARDQRRRIRARRRPDREVPRRARRGNGRLKAERDAARAPRSRTCRRMAATLTGYLMAAQEQPTELYKVGLGSVRFLLAVGDLLIGWLLLRQAEIAHRRARRRRPSASKDKAFYQGKIATASFFAKNMLPRLTATARHPRGDRQRHHGARRSRVLRRLAALVSGYGGETRLPLTVQARPSGRARRTGCGRG